MTVKMAVPTIGPSMLPTPPISATKIIFADHPTLKIALARTLSWLMISSAPPAPHPAADTTYTTRFAQVTRTPALPAATSLSRIAVRSNPIRLERSR